MGPAAAGRGFRRVAGDDVAEIARRSYAGEPVLDEEWTRVFSAFGPHLPNREREAHTPNNRELNARGMELIRRLDIVRQLNQVDSPTLVSVGELDPVTPVAAAEEIVDALPEGIAQFEIIDGAGHFTWMDAPERFWPVIIEFIGRTNRRMERDAGAVSEAGTRDHEDSPSTGAPHSYQFDKSQDSR